ncbi:MAG: hypothetical protein IPO15_03285 [Anaerolineae bacterium]|nr:hypothetical protein [Anaerolineae bacterium]
MANYEQQFGMSSPEFAVRYQSGEAGDSLDVFEWNVIYKMTRFGAETHEDRDEISWLISTSNVGEDDDQ